MEYYQKSVVESGLVMDSDNVSVWTVLKCFIKRQPLNVYTVFENGRLRFKRANDCIRMSSSQLVQLHRLVANISHLHVDAKSALNEIADNAKHAALKIE